MEPPTEESKEPVADNDSEPYPDDDDIPEEEDVDEEDDYPEEELDKVRKVSSVSLCTGQ